jgi:hypothetical protein
MSNPSAMVKRERSRAQWVVSDNEQGPTECAYAA